MSNGQKWRKHLTRRETSEYLLEVYGISRTHGTLAKLACIGGGPSFRKAGSRTTLYERAEVDRWANEILGPEQSSTSAAA